jgi:hypothetical protein
MKKTIQSVFTKKDFNFILSMDCEGYNFDKNLRENVLNLEKMLCLNTENDIYTLLFITPYFADMLYNLNLVEKIMKKYKTILGLHVHPNNLPEEINKKFNFINGEEALIILNCSSQEYEANRSKENKSAFKHTSW